MLQASYVDTVTSEISSEMSRLINNWKDEFKESASFFGVKYWNKDSDYLAWCLFNPGQNSFYKFFCYFLADGVHIIQRGQ